MPKLKLSREAQFLLAVIKIRPGCSEYFEPYVTPALHRLFDETPDLAWGAIKELCAYSLIDSKGGLTSTARRETPHIRLDHVSVDVIVEHEGFFFLSHLDGKPYFYFGCPPSAVFRMSTISDLRSLNSCLYSYCGLTPENPHTFLYGLYMLELAKNAPLYTRSSFDADEQNHTNCFFGANRYAISLGLFTQTDREVRHA